MGKGNKTRREGRMRDGSKVEERRKEELLLLLLFLSGCCCLFVCFAVKV